MKVEHSGENTLALGICSGAVIFTGTTQLSEIIFFYTVLRGNVKQTFQSRGTVETIPPSAQVYLNIVWMNI